MSETPEPVFVGADLISTLDKEIFAFSGPRVLFHVEIMCSERLFKSASVDIDVLARGLGEEVESQLKIQIPRFDPGDRLSKETYSAFVRYRKELAEIHRRHNLELSGG